MDLKSILKHKGIGPQGSKSLKQDQLDFLTEALADTREPVVTRATLFTALLTLPPNEAEELWLESFLPENNMDFPDDLRFLVSPDEPHPFLWALHHTIARQDLSVDEAEATFSQALHDQIPPEWVASFLEAQRLKRETQEENSAFFKVLVRTTRRLETDLPMLVDFADSYDGLNRSLQSTPFLMAAFAGMGIPSYTHGAYSAPPKEGVTSAKVLELAGKNIHKSSEEVLADIQNLNIRFGFLSQDISQPELYRLLQTRREMLKRPFLATFEKLCQPIRARSGNHIVTGYTHAPYKDKLQTLLQRQGLCNQVLIQRGTEGSTHLNPGKATTWAQVSNERISQGQNTPEDFNIPLLEVKAQPGITAEQSLEEGLAALNGKNNAMRAILVYTGAFILEKFGFAQAGKGREDMEMVLNHGQALEHWNALG